MKKPSFLIEIPYRPSPCEFQARNGKKAVPFLFVFMVHGAVPSDFSFVSSAVRTISTPGTVFPSSSLTVTETSVVPAPQTEPMGITQTAMARSRGQRADNRTDSQEAPDEGVRAPGPGVTLVANGSKELAGAEPEDSCVIGGTPFHYSLFQFTLSL